VRWSFGLKNLSRVLACSTATVAISVPCGVATAATVRGTHATDLDEHAYTQVVFQDRRGETNAVHVSLGSGRLRFTDRRAPVRALRPCRQLSSHLASCPTGGSPESHLLRMLLGRGSNRAVLDTPAAGSLHGGSGVSGGGGDDIVDSRRAPPPDTSILDVNDFSGGPGNDVYLGGPGPDTAFGGNGDDPLMGGAGVDLLVGDDGDDLVRGGPSRDLMMGDVTEVGWLSAR
jgi:hypothetical protein